MRDSDLSLASADKHSTEYNRRTGRFSGPELAMLASGR